MMRPFRIASVALLFLASGGHAAGSPLLWSSTGGGWRAMFADVGYTNLFRQAGLFSATGTEFAAISTTSGASWFSTQLFFSQVFYDRAVLSETPEALQEFVFEWMGSYHDMSLEVDDSNVERCDKLEGLGSFASEACALAFEHGGSWASFVHDMLKASGEALGDPSYYERIATPENRNSPLSNTDLLVQTALLPNGRYIDADTGVGKDVFLGYGDGDGGAPNLFTCALSATFVVEDSKAEFWYGTDDLTNQLQTYTAPAPGDYDPEDWEAFYLTKPARDGTVTIPGSAIGVDAESHTGAFAPAFGGPATTNVVQLSSTSSAAGGYPSPAMPSIYAQYVTTMQTAQMEGRSSGWTKLLLGILAGSATAYVVRYLVSCRRNRSDYERVPDGEDNGEDNGDGESTSDRCCNFCCDTEICLPVFCCLLVGGVVFTMYSFGSILIPTVIGAVSDAMFRDDSLDGLSVCSVWPNDCGPNDGQFSDGLFADGPAVAANIGHHLRTKGVDPNTPIKLIVTDTAQLADWDSASNYGQLLQYFETDFNQGVKPGGFLWNPGMDSPYRSPQIFEDYLDQGYLNSGLASIPGSNMTTATFATKTIDNPAFGVLAGQPVEILLLNLNAIMTTMVIGLSAIEENTQGLADMTNHVAFNEVLLERVRSFVADGAR